MQFFPQVPYAVVRNHAESATTACGSPEEAGAVCQAMFGLTGSESAARISDVFVARPAKIALILVLAWVVSRLMRKAIARFTRGLGAVSADVGATAHHSAATLLRTGGPTTVRTRQRSATVGALLGSVSTFTIWGVAALMVLGEFGIQLGPLDRKSVV